jgi:hypothetical protein
MDNKTKDKLILFFIKSPVSGQVKTRLAEQTGQEHAAELYKLFVLDLLESLKRLKTNFQIHYLPSNQKDEIKNWLGPQYDFTVQKGNDLGERMKNAFSNAFENNFNRVIIIGSDCPDLPPEFISQAFSELESYDAVIGPAIDGGYYLIGLTKNSFTPQAFENITWSSQLVLDQTIDILKKHNKKIFLLPAWNDIDTAEDLKILLQKSKNTEFENSKTFLYLIKNNPVNI